MDVIQIGLGQFGFSWLEKILLKNERINVVALVDKNKNTFKKVQQLDSSNYDVFTGIEEALNQIKADFILNVTPPKIHKKINFIALEEGIPVLCEKPIAESYEDAYDVLEKAEITGVPLMIAENYRFNESIRKVRKIIESGEIGKLCTVNIDFNRKHKMSNYHKDLKHPMLLDVGTHHLDMLRYLTGKEAKSVFARAWTPEWSWYDGYSSINLFIEMENNIKVSYRGSLSASNKFTDWLAKWRIEGNKGVIQIRDDQIIIYKDNNKQFISVSKSKDTRKKVLDEFINSLEKNIDGETDIKDNFKTFKIYKAAIESIQKNGIVKIID